MPASTIPFYKAALFEALQASNDPRLEGVVIRYGHVANGPPEFIALTDVTGTQSAASIGNGRRRRREENNLAVIVDVLKNTTDQRVATERAYVIASALENLLRESPRLEGFFPPDIDEYGQLISSAIQGEQQLTEHLDDTHRQARIALTVWFESRI